MSYLSYLTNIKKKSKKRIIMLLVYLYRFNHSWQKTSRNVLTGIEIQKRDVAQFNTLIFTDI